MVGRLVTWAGAWIRLCYDELVNGREFVRRARRYARRHGLSFSHNPARGKGSHSEVTVGERHTFVQYGEIHPDTLHDMFRDLRIDRRDF